MAATLSEDDLDRLMARLGGGAEPQVALDRQPVHTLYGGAHLYKPGASAKMGGIAQRTLDHYAPDSLQFARAFGLEEDVSSTLRRRVHNKLTTEPVEDQRIDFEDGYGYRPDAEEDGDALRAGETLAEGMRDDSLPPFIGIRIKSLSAESGRRALRTLDQFMTALLNASDGAVPDNFVVCLPKVTHADQVTVLAEALTAIEGSAGLDTGSLKLEIMVETTSAIFDRSGRCPLTDFVKAAEGRCVAAHFGTYDYTAECDISAAWQTHDHLSADFARSAMQVMLAGTGIRLSDGATTRMPVAPHRSVNKTLTEIQEQDNRDAVHGAWREHFDNVLRSLRNGFYQSWDLNPAQLPARYAAVYWFFLDALPDATRRLSAFVEKAAQANLVGSTFDDAATGQGLLNFFLRGIRCGALTQEDLESTGLTTEEIAGKSFMDIVASRSQG